MNSRHTGGNGNGRAKQGQVVDEHDSVIGGWDDHDNDWNPADFIISGSDHQGHSERIYCRVQPQHARAMNVIYKAGKFPFRTEGDLFRWCVVRGLKVLDKLDPMPGFLGAADAITEILRQEQYLQEFMAMFGKMETVINAHMAAGAPKEARRLLATVLQQVRAIEDNGDYWKRKCEAEVVRRFGHLMEGASGSGKGRARLNESGGDS